MSKRGKEAASRCLIASFVLLITFITDVKLELHYHNSAQWRLGVFESEFTFYVYKQILQLPIPAVSNLNAFLLLSKKDKSNDASLENDVRKCVNVNCYL